MRAVGQVRGLLRVTSKRLPYVQQLFNKWLLLEGGSVLVCRYLKHRYREWEGCMLQGVFWPWALSFSHCWVPALSQGPADTDANDRTGASVFPWRLNVQTHDIRPHLTVTHHSQQLGHKAKPQPVDTLAPQSGFITAGFSSVCPTSDAHCP